MARLTLMVLNSNQLLHILVIGDLYPMVRLLLAVQPRVNGVNRHLRATKSVSLALRDQCC